MEAGRWRAARRAMWRRFSNLRVHGTFLSRVPADHATVLQSSTATNGRPITFSKTSNAAATLAGCCGWTAALPVRARPRALRYDFLPSRRPIQSAATNGRPITFSKTSNAAITLARCCLWTATLLVRSRHALENSFFSRQFASKLPQNLNESPQIQADRGKSSCRSRGAPARRPAAKRKFMRIISLNLAAAGPIRY